jgi:toxin-antitoxin system PIN domain toxin
VIIPDVNLLVYAYDASCPMHRRARAWWEEALCGKEPVGIPWVVALAFVRLTTHPAVCAVPMTVAECRSAIETWLAQGHVSLLEPTPATFGFFFEHLASVGTGGNLTTDALIAAHATERGARVYSNDRDFARFRGIQWVNPLNEGERKK